MKTLTTNQVRQAFLDFFVSKNHTLVPSSPLIPFNDPTLLFTNAGMNQFKDTFLGLEKRDYSRATSSQKCVRAGGKHNDLDNVGYTARHHTFFEMLGNFSFGDYFKPDAICFAWEFLTSDQWLALPQDKLYVTIYATDDEAFDIWHNTIGLAPERIIRIGDNKGGAYQSDNFWMMGDTGPCGPCTEIFYDHGEHIFGGLPGTPDEDGDRFIEIWNCVFMQFNHQKDGTMDALPAPSVDTGMGLERIAAIMQGVHGNYEIDTFVHLMDAAAHILGINNDKNPSLKVIADHIRAVAFLIADGVVPSNEGRGYVLRRIIRRAVRHGNKLGATGAFFYELVPSLITEMGDAYPELSQQQEHIQALILKEESQFAKTLSQGLRLLDNELQSLSEGDTLSGETIFKLYDTYGFPMDLTADIAKERHILLDEAGFEREMSEQRNRAKDAGKFKVDYAATIKSDTPTEFVGYDQTTLDTAIVGLYQDANPSDRLNEGEMGIMLLNTTPFYAEGGGQVGDTGEISTDTGVFLVEDTQKSGQTILHHGKVIMGHISNNQHCTALVSATVRQDSAKNHSATHLLHAALRQVLGTGVAQKGSLVSSTLLRFDFSYDKPISQDELNTIEQIVNTQIQQNSVVTSEYMAIDDAKAAGAMALFGEKYGDTVRVLTMGESDNGKPFSIELCGGIHVVKTGDIGLFKIVSSGSIASGIRRIEALTGNTALAYIQQGERVLTTLGEHFKAQREEIRERVISLEQKLKLSEKQLERFEQKLAHLEAKNLLNNVHYVGDTPLLVAQITGFDGKSLRTLNDDMKGKLADGVIVLASTNDNNIALTASVAPSLTQKINAGDIIKNLADKLDGKGGGKAEFAQGSGTNTANLSSALTAIKETLTGRLA